MRERPVSGSGPAAPPHAVAALPGRGGHGRGRPGPRAPRTRGRHPSGLAVAGYPAAVPDDDDRVAVGVDPADRDRAEWLRHREPGAERGQDLIDELLLAAVLLRRGRVSL